MVTPAGTTSTSTAVAYSTSTATLASNIQTALTSVGITTALATVTAVSSTSVNVTFQGTDAGGVIQLANVLSGSNAAVTAVPAVNEVQTLAFPAAASGGTFTVAFNSVTSGPINYSTSLTTLASGIQTALNGLSSISGTGSVTVLPISGTSVGVTFGGGGFAGVAVTPLVSVSGVTANAVYTVNFSGSPTGGTFQLKFNGSSTATINYSTNPGTLQANIQNALDALSTIGAGNTQALVNAGATSATITFQNADAATPETPITATVGTLSPGSISVTPSTTTGFAGLSGAATSSQTFSATITTTAAAAVAPVTGIGTGGITGTLTQTGFGLEGATSPTASVLVANTGLQGLVGGSNGQAIVITTTQIGAGLTGSSPAVNAYTVTPGFFGDMVLATQLSGSYGLVKMGQGILTFAGSVGNVFSYATNVDEGEIVFDKQANVAAVSGPVVVGDYGGSATVKVASNYSQLNGQNIYVENGSTLDLTQSSSAAGLGTTTGQTIGTLNIYGGTVQSGTNTLTLGGDVTAAAVGASPGVLTGKVDLGSNTRNFFTLDATTASGTTFGLNVTAVISSASGTFGITKLGSGTLNLQGTAANTYTGTTTVNEGTLLLSQTGGVAVPANLVVGDGVGGSGSNKVDIVRLAASSEIATTAAVTINNSGLLDLNSNSNTIGSLVMTGGTVNTETGTLTLGGNVAGFASPTNLTPATINGNLSLGTAVRTFDVQQGSLPSNVTDLSESLAFSGTTANSGAFTLAFGTLTTNNITYSSVAATLQSNIATALAALANIGAGNVTVTGTNTAVVITIPAVGAQTITVASDTLSPATTVTPGTTTLTGGPQADMVINAVISGTGGGINKISDPGVLLLTAANTYTGATTVSFGSLFVDGSLSGSSAVTTTGGGVLGGTAFPTGSVGATVGTSGGTVNPGDTVGGVGVLTINSAIGTPTTLDLSNGGNLTLEINGYTTPGVSYDQLKLTGLGILKVGPTSTLTFDLAGLSGAASDGKASGVIQFNGLEGGQFGSILTTNNPEGLVPILTYNANSIDVNFAGPATHFGFTFPGGTSVTAGSPFVVTVTALDQFNGTAPSYTGTVHFTSSDLNPSVVLPGTAGVNTVTLTGGVGTFSATLITSTINGVTPNFQTITATDTTTGQSYSGITGSAAVTVNPSSIFGFKVSVGSNAIAGHLVGFTVTAQDQYGNTIPSYAGTVHFTSSDPNAQLSDDATLTAGVGGFAASLHTTGVQTITASQLGNSGISGISNSITVTAGAVKNFVITVPPSNATAGQSFLVTVTAEDAFGNLNPAYAGTVQFSSSDASATVQSGGLPANSTLVNGSGTFSFTLKAAGAQTVTASDLTTPSITATAPVTVAAGAINKFAVTIPGSGTTPAGSPLFFEVIAEDTYGNTVTGYTGTVHFSSTDGNPALPGDYTFTSGPSGSGANNGIAFFGLLLRTAGPQTVTATDKANNAITGTSGQITVTPLAANHFVVSVPASAITGTPFAVTVTAEDQFNNVVPGYTGTVHFTSSDSAATLPGSYTFSATTDQGVHVFTGVVLNTPGSQTITATDAGGVTGTNTSPIVSRGLTVTSLTPTPSGFTATFDKPFVPTDINLYDSSSGGGVDDVVLTGPNAPQISFHGSLIISANDQTITFVKTSNFTGAGFNPGTGVLSAGTYTVTFRSAASGFVDSLNGPLDGLNNGNPAGSNYVTTFVVTTPPVVVAVPAFARGPDSVDTINLPNSATTGIPLNVSVANGITSGKFTLQYNSALLSITAAFANTSLSGASLSLDAASTAGTAILDFSSPTALTQTSFLRLGGLTATVPATANSLYRSKALLHWSGVTLNGGAINAEGGDAVEIVAYFGDASGTANGNLSGGDASDISAVATGISTNGTLGTLGGFAAFPLGDPVIVADLNNDGLVDASDVTLLNSVLSGTPRTQIPTIPTNVAITAYGPDPALSLPTTLVGLPGSTVVVPVNIDTAKPVGSNGATEAILALKYNPQVFTVSPADVQAGSLTSGWQVTTVVNAQTGEIGIDIFSSSPIQTTLGGSLVTISLHVRDTAPAGQAALTLVNQVNPTGQRLFTTTVSDGNGAFVLHTTMTVLGSEPGEPGQVTVISGQSIVASAQAVADSTLTAADKTASNVQLSSHSQLPAAYYLEQVFGEIDPMLVPESTIAQPAAILNTESNDPTSVSNTDKALVQPLADAQHDWVPAELLEHFGRDGHNVTDEADLAGLEAFFAGEANGNPLRLV